MLINVNSVFGNQMSETEAPPVISLLSRKSWWNY